jgi:hypothetical protein
MAAIVVPLAAVSFVEDQQSQLSAASATVLTAAESSILTAYVSLQAAVFARRASARAACAAPDGGLSAMSPATT